MAAKMKKLHDFTMHLFFTVQIWNLGAFARKLLKIRPRYAAACGIAGAPSRPCQPWQPPMATSVKLQAEPPGSVYPHLCPSCRGQGKVLYPFPGDGSDRLLGGVKIMGVTCRHCGGSGHTIR